MAKLEGRGKTLQFKDGYNPNRQSGRERMPQQRTVSKGTEARNTKVVSSTKRHVYLWGAHGRQHGRCGWGGERVP